MNLNSGIYMIRHKESGKTYIGRSVDIYTRWHQHKSDAKSQRTNNPLHNAIRKYGSEAFYWKILVSVPGRLQSKLERQFIIDMKTMAPNGYNLGGTEGGFPSDDLIALMPEDEQVRWRAVMLRAATAGHEALREMRKDPNYEKSYLEIKSAASSTREARIRERCAVDPDYAAKLTAGRRARSLAAPPLTKESRDKASATFKERFSTDSEYAARVSEDRKRAAKIGWENRRALKRAKEAATMEALKKCLFG